MKTQISDVKFVKDYYPRFQFSQATVNAYKLALDELPPIEVNSEGYLVDGYHRLLAHRLAGVQEIEVRVVDVAKEQILFEATKRNSMHGLQLSMVEKKDLAPQFYKQGYTQQQIADVLSISPSTISAWLSNLVRELKEQQKHKIIDLHLQCLTQEEIANKIGLTHGRIAQIVNKFKTEEINNFVPDALQLYNVWNFPNRDKRYGLDFKGAIPGQIVENLLYYFTEPFDVVVDPMAGGGTTLDVCKAMMRRYRAFDVNPMRDDIKKHDIRTGYPGEASNCDFIFLDPPYFNMVFKDLFKDIQDFQEFMTELAKNSYNTVKPEGYVAVLIADMTELGNYCLSGDAYCTFASQGFKSVAHISAPMTTQQFLPQQVDKAKKDKHLLGTNRDLYVFKK